MITKRLVFSVAPLFFVSLLLLFSGTTQAQNRESQEAAQSTIEALALQAASGKDPIIPRPLLCKKLANATALRLQELWKRLCSNQPPVQGIVFCVSGYFECLRKEDMAIASGKMPSGGSFDCGRKANSCNVGSK